MKLVYVVPKVLHRLRDSGFVVYYGVKGDDGRILSSSESFMDNNEANIRLNVLLSELARQRDNNLVQAEMDLTAAGDELPF